MLPLSAAFFSVILILMLLLVVFSVFDWHLGFDCIEDLEIYERFDKHCSCQNYKMAEVQSKHNYILLAMSGWIT
jgi:hypothetical protein